MHCLICTSLNWFEDLDARNCKSVPWCCNALLITMISGSRRQLQHYLPLYSRSSFPKYYTVLHWSQGYLGKSWCFECDLSEFIFGQVYHFCWERLWSGAFGRRDEKERTWRYISRGTSKWKGAKYHSTSVSPKKKVCTHHNRFRVARDWCKRGKPM